MFGMRFSEEMRVWIVWLSLSFGCGPYYGMRKAWVLAERPRRVVRRALDSIISLPRDSMLESAC